MPAVLIAEDDLLISELLEDAVAAGGYTVCGVAATVPEAFAIVEREPPDLAIIDVRLADGGDGIEIAVRLMKNGRIGVLYATGNVDQVLAAGAPGHACLKKPYRPSDVVRALGIVEHLLATGAPPATLPPGLILLRPLATAGSRS